MWHRLFGQDVTLWGPTHLMLIGGAGMTLIGQAVLLQEGIRARPARAGRPAGRGLLGRYAMLRQVALMGGLLIGLSTFQAEFDFGVPQFRAVFQPMLIARRRRHRARGGPRLDRPGRRARRRPVLPRRPRASSALIVGPVLGETTPSLPLYLVEALASRPPRSPSPAAARSRSARRRACSAGTVGFAAEWGWTHVAFRLPWEAPLLPEGLAARRRRRDRRRPARRADRAGAARRAPAPGG